MAEKRKINLMTPFLLVFLFCFVVLSTVETNAAEDKIDSTKNDHSIVGGFVHFVGEVVAFPFRIVGEMVDAIF